MQTTKLLKPITYMKRFFTIILSVLLCISTAVAHNTTKINISTETQNSSSQEEKKPKRERKVNAFEIEIGIGAALGANNLKFDKTKTGFNGLAEVRYNTRCGVDFGVQFSINGFNRQTMNAEAVKFLSKNGFIVLDYNLFQDKGLTIFFGAGAGIAWNKNTGESTVEGDDAFLGKSRSFCVMPRVGIELFHRIRVTLDYKFGNKANNHFGLSAGFVLGGGKK